MNIYVCTRFIYVFDFFFKSQNYVLGSVCKQQGHWERQPYPVLQTFLPELRECAGTRTQLCTLSKSTKIYLISGVN